MNDTANITLLDHPWNAADVPPAFAPHRLVGDRLFYTIPRALLDSIGRWAPSGALEPDLLPVEDALADVCARPDAQVGFWNGRPVWYTHLASAPALAELADSRPVNWRDDPRWNSLAWLDNSATVADVDKLTAWNGQVSRGYCGWLVTNVQFVREHDDFFAAWHTVIRPRASMPYHDRRAQWTDELRPCVDAYAALCGRWQLAGLAGPYLPVPLGPQLPLADLSLMPPTALAGGTLLYLPNTHALPDRAMLRKMIEDALDRRSAPDHLREWAGLVEAAHPGKRTIARYGRVFQLQHYRRVLHRRHGRFLKGHRDDLTKAMVSVLFPGDDDVDDKRFESVKKDVDFLSERLGASDWHAKSCALDHF